VLISGTDTEWSKQMNNTPQETITQDRADFEREWLTPKYTCNLPHYKDRVLDLHGQVKSSAWELWQACAQLTRERQAKSGDAVVIDSVATGIINGKRKALPMGTTLFTAPQQAIPSGWKLVPIEPTDEMKEKCWEAYRDSNKPAPYNMLTDAYKAMLSASPTAPIDNVREALETAIDSHLEAYANVVDIEKDYREYGIGGGCYTSDAIVDANKALVDSIEALAKLRALIPSTQAPNISGVRDETK